MKRSTTIFIEFLGWVSAALAVLILLGDLFLAAAPTTIGGLIPPGLLSLGGVLLAAILAVVFFWMAGIGRDLAAIRKALAGEPGEAPSEETPSGRS